MRNEPLLSVEDLRKTFRLHMQGGLEVHALRGVSFRVDRGEFVGLSGPSGAGKSTVLKVVHRTYLPTSGSVRFESAAFGAIDLAAASEARVVELRKREIGYVSQFLRVIPRVGARDLVAEPIQARLGLSREEALDRAGRLLDRLRIPRALRDAYPSTFSGGEQQRVNIARAVGWKPALLLLDEPTASLDAGSCDIVLEILRELRDQGSTMLGIFHDPELMGRIADRTIPIGGD
jgi:alpha-D-ribose 1-methylphosphonate 5-triphosphate synthase subunit PhnL